MKDNKTLFILRCHCFDEAEVYLLESVLSYFGRENILVAVDERSKHIDITGWNKVSLSNEKLENIGIFPHPKCGWLCGDYFLYMAYESYPDYDYYWLCEPDVYFSFSSVNLFFKEFEKNKADLLAVYLSKRNESWPWTKRARIISENVYGCYFPIIRISRTAIIRLQYERINLSNLYKNNILSNGKWLNDESFVCTVLMRDNFDCQSFENICNFFDRKFFSRTRKLWDKVANEPPVNKVLHSVIHYHQFQEKSIKIVNTQVSRIIRINLAHELFPHISAETSYKIAISILVASYKELKNGFLEIHPDLLIDLFQEIDNFFNYGLKIDRFVMSSEETDLFMKKIIRVNMQISKIIRVNLVNELFPSLPSDHSVDTVTSVLFTTYKELKRSLIQTHTGFPKNWLQPLNTFFNDLKIN